MTEFIPPAKPLIGDEERAAVDRVLRSGMLAQGPEVAAFEEEFSEHFGLGRACVAVNSGTSGLHLGLLAAGVGRATRSSCPSFTFAATANSVALTGATPVFADIEPDDFCLDPAAVEAAITERTVGDHAGAPLRPPGRRWTSCMASRRPSTACRSSRTRRRRTARRCNGTPGRRVRHVRDVLPLPDQEHDLRRGRHGLGAPTPRSSALMRLLRNQGMEKQYDNEVVGFNTRMTDIHAAIGRVQLTKLAGWTKQRQENAAFLVGEPAGRRPRPPVAEGAVHVYHQYTVRVPEDRDGFAAALREEYGVGSGDLLPDAQPPAGAVRSGLDASTCPRPSGRPRECLSLPVHPSLSQDDLERIVDRGQRPREGGCLMANLRAGLIGLGMMGRHHARVLRLARRGRPRRRRRPRR